jgi:hypothetical protein
VLSPFLTLTDSENPARIQPGFEAAPLADDYKIVKIIQVPQDREFYQVA